MKKYNIHTTLSSKHWEILRKNLEQHKTQQKVLELALESLEKKQDIPQSPEEELWMRIGGKIKAVGLIQKEGLKVLIKTMDTDLCTEFVKQQKPIEYTVEFYYQKPLKECTLKEVIEGLIVTGNISCMMDSVGYTDCGDHYLIKITHDMGLNDSKMLKVMIDSLFTTYGAKTDIQISERSVFVKVFKKLISGGLTG